MHNQKKAIFYALLAILFWSTMGSAFKLSLSYMTYAGLLLWSSLVSLIVLGLLITILKKWTLVVQAGRRDWMMSAIMGLLNPFGYYFILFKAYSMIRAQEAVALNYTWPLVLVLLSIPVLKQKTGFRTLLSVLVSFIGALLVVTKGDFSFLSVQNPAGSLLALSSSVLWAAFWLLNMKDSRREEVKLFMNFAFGFAYSLVFAAISGELYLPQAQGAAGVVYIGVFEMGITFFFWLKALQYARTTASVTRLVYISPFLSLLLIHFLVGENIHYFTWIGLALIIGGILADSLFSSRKPA